jgi:murein DD-endopeptidase MepM/ murein hydrolase activator NlpD
MKLPPPNEYRVRIGDSLQSIAALYEVSPAKLEKLNGLKEPYYLTPGQILRLPTSYQKNVVGVPRNVSGQRSAVATTRGISPQPVEREALAPLPTKKSVAAVPKRSIPKNVVSNIKPEIPKPQVKTASVPKAKTPSIPKLAAGNFMRPVDGKIVSSFGTKKDGLHNDGINIKAVKGTPVRAAQNGVVVYNGDDLEGYGNLVLIRHENKMVTAYAHLDKTLVKRGAKVSRGQSIGTVGKTGQVDTPQLHFEIRKGSTPLNPDKFL